MDEGGRRRPGRPRGGRGRGGSGFDGRLARDRNREAVQQRRQRQQPDVVPSYPVFGSLTDYTETMIDCAREFDEAMRSIEISTCTKCKRSFPGLKINAANHCNHCTNARTANMFTKDNLMDPGDIPPELKDLTDIEKMLIAQVHPVIRLYRLRGAQYAFSGNVISFRQNIDTMCTVLPRLPSDVATILFDKSTPTGITTFKANRRRIERALKWLKEHNEYYHNITISQDNLDLIPEEGDLAPLLLTLFNDSQPESQPSTSQEASIDENESIEESFVPLMEQLSMEESVRRGLKMPFPGTDNEPVNEFETEGFIARAFPALFPTGEADFLNHRRPHNPSRDEYFKYLLEYHDRRFIKEPRFVYFAMNMVQRHQAISCANVYMKRNQTSVLTSAQVLAQMRTNPNFIKKIMVYTAKIRSTTPFWAQKCGELLDMVKQIGPPTIFFTLSAADYHWPDLYRLLAPGEDPERLTSKRRADLMHENFDICAFFFMHRCEQFIKLVLSKVWKIEDMWYRYEWQWRGSPHLHGLLWLEDAPSIEKPLSEEDTEAIRQYFDRMCSAWNLEFTNTTVANQKLPHNNPPPINPCRKRFSDIPESEREDDLGELLNTFQRHSKCDPRCLRKIKNIIECRFKFPFDFCLDESKLVSDEHGELLFYPKRNDRYMGKFNPFATQTWRANTDWSLVVSLKAVLNYIAKYASKGEKTSQTLQELIDFIADKVDSTSPGGAVITSCATSCVGERDYPAQEAVHVLKGFPLYHCSRAFVTLCLFDDDWQHVTVGDDDQLKFGKNLVQKYRDRPDTDEFRNVNLLDFSKNYYTKKQAGVERYVKRRREAIVRIFPRFKLSGDDEQNEKFYRQQVILQVPFRNEPYSDLLLDPSTNILHETWLGRFESLDLDVDEPLEMPEEDDEGEVLPDINEQNVQDPHMVAAGLLNNILVQQGAPAVGNRPMDLAYDWLAASSDHPDIAQVDEFLKTFNQSGNYSRQETLGQSSQPATVLSSEQDKIMDICKAQVEYLKTTQGNPSKLVLVQGVAGSGKSTVIKAIVDHVKNELGPESIKVCAPTGVAALNVNGQTIHSLLHIVKFNEYEPLSGVTLPKFIQSMRDVKILVIDEMSMVSAKLLFFIDQRCREARPTNSTKLFGGIMVYFCGDFRQIPPVAQAPLYRVQWRNMEYVPQGRLIFDLFKDKYELRQCLRQQGPEQETFRSILGRLWKGSCTAEDHQLLMQRRKAVLSEAEKASFDKACHLFTTNKACTAENNRQLAKLGVPVARIVSLNRPGIPLDEDESQMGLNHVLNLAVGCRVMLRANIWVQGGLVNSSMGTVRAIVYDGQDRPPLLPKHVMVEFDDYQGPYFPGSNKLFPIKPITRNITKNGRNFMRTQLPLSLGYAFTIHKCQGLTLQKIVVDIGNSEKTAGMTYVALSRVKRLEDIMFERAFPLSRITTSIANAFGQKEREELINKISSESII